MPLILFVDNPSKRKTRTDVLKEQLINSLIVAGIAFLSVMPPGLPTLAQVYVAAKAFGITFLVEMRKYRGL